MKVTCLLLFASVFLVACGSGERIAPKERVPSNADDGEVSQAAPAAAALPAGRMVDLTYAFDEGTIYWPTAEGFRLKADFVGQTDKGYFYSAYQFSTAEHGGTHIDAPVHFSKDQQTVDAIPLERLMGEAAVIDVTDACRESRDYQIQIKDLRAWEEQHNRPLNDMIVILRTGFGRHWPDREKYLGTAERGAEAVPKLHFPGLHPQASRWLVAERTVKAVGIDTASIDYGQSTHFESHVTLFGANIPAFENVAHADQLPPAGATIIALPMKIRGGSGGPLRMVAIVPEIAN